MFYFSLSSIAINLLHMSVIQYPVQRTYKLWENATDTAAKLILVGWLAYLLWVRP